MYSGRATSGATPSFIECADSVLSGTPGGEIVISAGAVQMSPVIGGMTITGGLTVDSLTVTGANSFSVKDVNMNPTMGIPPNQPTAGKTLAQTQAFIDGMFNEMESRGFFT